MPTKRSDKPSTSSSTTSKRTRSTAKASAATQASAAVKTEAATQAAAAPADAPAPKKKRSNVHSSGYKGISRIDSDKRNTHGWYVRVLFRDDARTKFFSDSIHGGTQKALNKAIRYRNEAERELGKPRTDRTVVANSPRNQTGILGVHRIVKGGGEAYEVTWNPRPNVVQRTSVSIAKYGEEEAFRRACRIRARKEKAVYGKAITLVDKLPPAPKSENAAA